MLLGKILRIDVDHADPVAGTAYSPPADNPFVNAPGRDEIFAYGMRNPWRFTFDRVTGVQWVADVGQSAREEVDMPIVPGGNYGWRVCEGSALHGQRSGAAAIRRAIVRRSSTTSHSSGRCSITGGYVYRGAQGALPGGTYVYGDYCSGEIFAWNGTTQSRPARHAAQHLVVRRGRAGRALCRRSRRNGEQDRSRRTTCTYAISPSRATFAMNGGGATVSVMTAPGCTWTVASNATWITISGATGGRGEGTVTYAVAPYTEEPKARNGTLTIAGKSFAVQQTKLRPLPRRDRSSRR